MEHVLYGVKETVLARVGQIVSSILSVELVERESDYLGVYLNGAAGLMKVRVVSQLDPEGELLEPDFPEWNILIYVDGPDELPSLENLDFEGEAIHLLRRDIV